MHPRKDKTQTSSTSAAKTANGGHLESSKSSVPNPPPLALRQKTNGHRTPVLNTISTDANDLPPTPPPKDGPPTPRSMLSRRSTYEKDQGPNDESFFRPYPLSRAGSIYSLSRMSFQSQISQLTSIQLPESASLADSIKAIPSAASAVRTLNEAADQIQKWIAKASEVLKGLDAGDDAEWAAAAGRDGLGEVDQAINRFESLIQVYISSVEGVQQRPDASLVSRGDMNRAVGHIEHVATEWKGVKSSLDEVKHQVELAMEWEELETNVIGEITVELEDLARAVFEMEERRHQIIGQGLSTSGQNVDLGDIETMMDESTRDSGATSTVEKRASLLPDFRSSPLQSPEPAHESEESELIGIFARLQPLRASLDFLPMRISPFQNRAKNIFPSACSELESRRESLEEQRRQLEADAHSLRRELSEDRWVAVFRNAGKQAMKMIDSVARSINKADESLESNMALQHAPSTTKKIENYQAKKLHYCPAIERVLGIVERGVRDRLTVNGAIIRLQADLRQKWQSLVLAMKNLDAILEDYRTSSSANQQLRDSLSSILSSDRSMGSSFRGSPGSSPASSIGPLSRKPSHLDVNKTSSDTPVARRASGEAASTPTSGKRHSSLPVPARKQVPTPPSTSSMPQRAAQNGRGLQGNSLQPTPPSRPRWNGSTRVNEFPLGQYFKTPSRVTPRSQRLSSAPTGAASTPPSLTKRASQARLGATSGASSSMSHSHPSATSSPTVQTPPSKQIKQRSSFLSLASSPLTRHRTRSDAEDSIDENSPIANASSRPGSSLGARIGKRISMIPRPSSRLSSSSHFGPTSPNTTPLASKRTSGVMSSPSASSSKH